LNHVQHGSSGHEEPDHHKRNRFEVTEKPCPVTPTFPHRLPCSRVRGGDHEPEGAGEGTEHAQQNLQQPDGVVARKEMHESERNDKQDRWREEQKNEPENRPQNEPQRCGQKMHVVRELRVGIHTFPPVVVAGNLTRRPFG